MTGTFEGVGSLQFSPDNKFAYAYSGYHSFSNTELTILEFNTQSEYLRAHCQYAISDDGLTINEDDSYIKFYFNDTLVFAQVDSGDPDRVQDAWPILIIPPFTNVKIAVKNQTDASNLAAFVCITGKVYGAIEQENLESITDNNKWAKL